MDFHIIDNISELDFDKIKKCVLDKTETTIFEFLSPKFLEGSFGIVYFHENNVIKFLKDIKNENEDNLNDTDEFCYNIICSQLTSSLKLFCLNFLDFYGFKRIEDNNNIYNFLNYERVDGDLFDLFNFYKIKTSTMKNILFQIMFALLISRKKIGFTHQDLHCGNILFNKDTHPQKNVYNYYIINDKKYYLPYSEYIFILSDFDTSILDSLHGVVENKNLITLRNRKKDKVKYPLSETGDLIYFFYDMYTTFRYYFNRYLSMKTRKIILSIIKYTYFEKFTKNIQTYKDIYFSIFDQEPSKIEMIDYIDKIYESISYTPTIDEEGICLGVF